VRSLTFFLNHNWRMKLFIETPHGFRHLGDLDEDGYFEPSIEFEDVDPNQVAIPMSDYDMRTESVLELMGFVPEFKTVKVIDLIDRAETVLQDTSNTRWAQAELLSYLNDAHREIVMQRPDAKVANATLGCSASSKQVLPSGALRLIDVVRNLNGKAITQIDRKVLDVQNPSWHTGSGNTAIEHFMYNPADPKVFYVYPVPKNTVEIEIAYSQSTTDIAISNYSSDTATISLDDTYSNAILDYMLYRAYQKDSDFGGNMQKVATHYQSFANSIGLKTRADLVITPQADETRSGIQAV
jgi:hypothetical protein